MEQASQGPPAISFGPPGGSPQLRRSNWACGSYPCGPPRSPSHPLVVRSASVDLSVEPQVRVGPPSRSPPPWSFLVRWRGGVSQLETEVLTRLCSGGPSPALGTSAMPSALTSAELNQAGSPPLGQGSNSGQDVLQLWQLHEGLPAGYEWQFATSPNVGLAPRLPASRRPHPPHQRSICGRVFHSKRGLSLRTRASRPTHYFPVKGAGRRGLSRLALPSPPSPRRLLGASSKLQRGQSPDSRGPGAPGTPGGCPPTSQPFHGCYTRC